MGEQSFITVDEVLQELRIHRSTLYRLQKSGALNAFKKIGDRRSYYERQEIAALKRLQLKNAARKFAS